MHRCCSRPVPERLTGASALDQIMRTKVRRRLRAHGVAEERMISRRALLGAGAVFAGGSVNFGRTWPARADELKLPEALPAGVRAEAVLEALPGKEPLIKLSYRPPNYETPIEYFRTA